MKKFLCYTFIVILTCSCLKQEASAQRFNYSFEQFTTDNGLSHESVTSITKDRDGFLWIGTANGLNRFDGVSFKVFLNNPNSDQSIPGNYIAGTTLDKKGYLWVSTNNGLCRIDTRTLKFNRINLKADGESNSREEVMYGEFDSKGKGWFLVNQFFYEIDQETLKWKRYPLPTNRFHANLTQIDSKDRLWVSIGRAKYTFDRTAGNFNYVMGYDFNHRNTDTLCGSIKEDANGRVWMNTWDKGFFKWNESTQKFDPAETPTESITTFEFDKDEEGRPFIWCGGGPYGLMAFDTTEKNIFNLSMIRGTDILITSGKQLLFFVTAVPVLCGWVPRMVWRNMIRTQSGFIAIAYGNKKMS